MEVSIIMPVYNSEKYLPDCLNSIFNQSYQNFDLICVNDGSTDDSLFILNEYANKYKNKMKIITINNTGQANARNIGIQKADGRYVMFVDSDDILNESLLEKLYAKASSEDADIAICNLDRIFDEHIKGAFKNFKYDTQINIAKKTTIYEQPEIICFLHGAPYGKLIRRSFMEKYNIRFLKGYIYEDQAFTQELLSTNPTIVQIPEKLYVYKVHDHSTMTSKTSKIEDMFHIFNYIYDIYKEKGLHKKFKKELDYLCLYHIMIGTSFRMWRSGKYGLLESIKKCRKFVNSYNVSKKNVYLKKKGFISRLFVYLCYREEWENRYER